MASIAEVEGALLRAAKQALIDGIGRAAVHVDGLDLEVAVKAVDADDRRSYVMGHRWRVLLRADSMAANRTGRADGLDRKLWRWCDALDVLFHGAEAPFSDLGLMTDDVNPADSFADNFATGGRFRAALWAVGVTAWT